MSSALLIHSYDMLRKLSLSNKYFMSTIFLEISFVQVARKGSHYFSSK